MNTREINKLDDLMDGAVTERFNNQLAEVLRNVFDPNTSAKSKRRIQLIFDFFPNERRDAMEFRSDVKATLAPPAPLSQTVFIGMSDDGTVRAMEQTNQIPGQVDIDGDIIIPNVVEFARDSKN